MLNRFDLSGKTAVVTGGAGLLGPQHCSALLELGADVAIVDIDLSKATRAASELATRFPKATCKAYATDITDINQVRELSMRVSKDLGTTSILVNNAAIDAKVSTSGGMIQSSRFENFSIEQWNKEIAVGLTGAMLCSQVFGAAMQAAGSGVILQIASDLSVIAPDQRLYRKPGLTEDQQPVKPVTYSVIKTALVGLTRYLAAYWATDGVRVNCLSPGGVYNGQPEEFVEKLTQLIPMGRMAQPQDYREAIQFLCSDASSYLTGQNIVMDGGRSIL